MYTHIFSWKYFERTHADCNLAKYNTLGFRALRLRKDYGTRVVTAPPRRGKKSKNSNVL